MKKGLIVFLLITALFVAPASVKADDTPRVFVDGAEISFNVPPVIIDGRVFVPLSTIFTALGQDVCWQESGIVTTQQGLWMRLGDGIAYRGDKTIEIDPPIQIIEGRVMVPLKFVAEACLCKVQYDKSSNSVYLDKGMTNSISAYLYQGLEPSGRSGLSESREFSYLSPAVYASIWLGTDRVSDVNVLFNWQYEGTKGLELIQSSTSTITNGSARSILPKDKYRTGKWTLEILSNDQIVQTRYFKIIGGDDFYGTVSWENGTYTGYLKDGYPCGYGIVKLPDGTKIVGIFSNEGVSLIMNGVRNYSYIKYTDTRQIGIYGYWLYPDGSSYMGSLSPVAVAKNQGGFDSKEYQTYCNIGGNYTYADGTSKGSNYSCFKDYDPTYRFDKLDLKEGYISNADDLGKFKD